MDEHRYNELFERYLPKLVRLAQVRISEKYQSKLDSEDLAATVCRTVFRRLQEGSLTLGDDAELWKLFVTITIRKISNKVRYLTADIRDANREGVFDPELHTALSREPGPSESLQFVDLLETLEQRLDSLAIKVLNLRLLGWKTREIAIELGVVERTVGRKLELIREELQALSPVTSTLSDPQLNLD